ncbi:MAG: hypothetical protein KJ970_17705 [Candidatus Eisenbacteria bacterium]|uniref:Phosphotyrosine protein phosphatase I domain-containing protein n=1 Tax=Eiseniibacteriota bacterium TaxID=2212470 RepID=A0A948W8J3_UNCEI|nr:hypothetical protein [Candidatus Eisenbacteria bacterium]MBU1951232.1 hypothetical protein [Candidatus Eisenbacteria bacterium]MBU2692756.1 hypothetical protein [Candidatus Eisenbacteria bacterium]
MDKVNLLFVCSSGGARSLIAAAFANRLSPGHVAALGACFDPDRIGSLPIAAAKEIDMEIPSVSPKSVYDLYREQAVFDHVVSMCYQVDYKHCPIFMTNIDLLFSKKAEVHKWMIPDFRSLEGSAEEKRLKAAEIVNQIGENVAEFLVRIGVADKVIRHR